MSTFLQLVQDLHAESGAAGVAPTSVLAQTGEAARLVNWTRRADLFVQSLWDNWKFLRQTYSQPTVTNQPNLPKPNRLAMWDSKTFFIVPPGGTVGVDNESLCVVEYNKVRSEILDTTFGQPSRVIIMPDRSLKFEQVPDGAYTILADYYLTPLPLAANTDVSAIPEEFHQVILGRALMLYSNYENAPEAKKQGMEIYQEALERLQNKELANEDNAQFRTDGGFEVFPE